jgi:hypothetical protein
VLLDAEVDEPDVGVLDDELPPSEDLLFESLLLAAGALPEDEPRLSVR